MLGTVNPKASAVAQRVAKSKKRRGGILGPNPKKWGEDLMAARDKFARSPDIRSGLPNPYRIRGK